VVLVDRPPANEDRFPKNNDGGVPLFLLFLLRILKELSWLYIVEGPTKAIIGGELQPQPTDKLRVQNNILCEFTM
jgi:hypothetical protein